MNVAAWIVLLSIVIILGVLLILLSFGCDGNYYEFAIGIGCIILGLMVGASVLQQCPNCTSTQLTANHYCTNCQYDFEEDAIRYWECECGNKLPTSNKYCPYCGSPKEVK